MVKSDDIYDAESFPDSVEAAKARLEDAGFSVTARREHGSPTETILSVADELDVDQLVLAGRKKSPVGKVLFGSVTQGVLSG